MSGTVQSLTRGLGLLRLLAAAPTGLALRDIARAANLKRPTAHKLLHTLIENGFAEKTNEPALYRPGAAVFELGRASRDAGFLRDGADVVQALAGRLPLMTVTLARFIGGEVSTILRMSPERRSFLERPVDLHLGPYLTASALLFQAYWTEDERAAYRRRHSFEDYQGRVWKRLEDVDRFLVDVRRKGYAAAPCEPGLLRVAVPILGAGGRVEAALGISGPVTGTKAAQKGIEVVREAARRFSSAREEAGA